MNEITETICFLKGAYRKLTLNEIVETLNKSYGYELTKKEVSNILNENKELVQEYRKGGVRALKKGIALGTFKHTTLYDRMKTLNEIVNLGKDGYIEEKATGRGDVVETRTVNLNASLDALKTITFLMQRLDDDEEEEKFEFRVVLDED